MNTGRRTGEGKALGAPVAALSVALLIVVAVFAYAELSSRQGTPTSSPIAPSIGTSATGANQVSTSYSTPSTSSGSSATTSTSSSRAITIFQSMPTSSAPQPQRGVFDPAN